MIKYLILIAAVVLSPSHIPDRSPIKFKRNALPPVFSKTYTQAEITALIGATAELASGTAETPRTVTLPTGRYNGTLRIPNGTHDLIIDGAGIGLTVVELDTATSDVVKIGKYNHTSNYQSTITLSNVAKGATTVTTLVGQTEPVDEAWYCLTDSYLVTENAGGTTVKRIREEIVQVASVVDNGNGTYTATLRFADDSPTGMHASLLQTGAGRAYNSTPRLGKLFEDTPTYNITIKDLEVRAKGGSNVIEAGLCDNLTIQNCKVSSFQTNAFRIHASTNVVIEDCIASGATSTGSGAGYGFTISRSRNVKLDTCQGLKGSTGNMRHSVILDSGTMDTYIVDCLSDKGSYDSHGTDEKRQYWLRCNATALLPCGADFGNNAWPAGAEGVRVEDCDMYGPIGFHANTSSCVVVDGHYSKLRLEYTNDADGFPVEGKVDDLTMTGTVFTNSLGNCVTWYAASGGVVKVGTITFDTCQLNCTATSSSSFRCLDIDTDQLTGGDDLRFAQVEGTIVFDTCAFTRSGHASAVSPIHVQPGARTLNFSLLDCTISSLQTQYGLFVEDIWQAGDLIATNNALTTNVASPALLLNSLTGASGVAVTASGNTAGP